MKSWLVSSFSLLGSACAAAPVEQEWLPSTQGFRYHAEASALPAGVANLHLHLRLPDDSIHFASGSALVGNAPLTIVYPPELRAESSAEHSAVLTIGPAQVSWTKKVEATGSHLELDIESKARPIELTLDLVPRAGVAMDAEKLREELDRGLTVFADGKPIQAGATRLERTGPVVVSASAPR